MPEMKGVTQNHGYFPIFVDEATYPITRDALYEVLKNRGMFGRRYFYPLISEFPAYRGLPSSADVPVAMRISRGVLCLPIYASLDTATVEAICRIVREPAGN